MFSAFALVRTIRYLYQRLQRLLGLRQSCENEDLWAESEGKVARAGLEDKMANSAKSWPIFLFFAVILGGPYLIWKLLSTYSDEETGKDDLQHQRSASCVVPFVVACTEMNLTLQP